MTNQPSRGVFGKLVFGTLVALTSLVVIPLVRLVFKRRSVKSNTAGKIIDVQVSESLTHSETKVER